jgi:hypothetical protein
MLFALKIIFSPEKQHLLKEEREPVSRKAALPPVQKSLRYGVALPIRSSSPRESESRTDYFLKLRKNRSSSIASKAEPVS